MYFTAAENSTAAKTPLPSDFFDFFFLRVLLNTALRCASILILLAASATSAWAAPLLCLNEGLREATAAYTVPGTIPPGFGVTGPKDLDAGADDGVDACKTFYFNVPPVNYADKDRPGGWGGLIITFDRPVDGASFIFDPACAIPIQGIPFQLSPNGEAQAFQFKNLIYGFLPTDSPEKNNRGVETGSGKIYSPLVVTVMYDSTGVNDTGPNIIVSANGIPQSYWQGKPSKQGFNFEGPDGFLLLSIPEPSTLLLFALGFLSLAFVRRRRGK